MRKALAILLPVALTVAMAGCFDVHFMKTLLFGPEKEWVGYRDVEGPSIIYTYDTDWVNFAIHFPYFWEETDKEFSRAIPVKKGSTRITLNYNVTMENPNEEFWMLFQFALKELGLDETLAEEVARAIKSMDRHVEIKLIDPDDRVTFNVTVNQTTDGVLQYFEPDPVPGMWTLKVNSRGFGFKSDINNLTVEYRDSYAVMSVIREPYYR